MRVKNKKKHVCGKVKNSDVDPHWLYSDPDPQNLINADLDPHYWLRTKFIFYISYWRKSFLLISMALSYKNLYFFSKYEDNVIQPIIEQILSLLRLEHCNGRIHPDLSVPEAVSLSIRRWTCDPFSGGTRTILYVQEVVTL